MTLFSHVPCPFLSCREQNNVDELWSILHFLEPQVIDNQKGELQIHLVRCVDTACARHATAFSQQFGKLQTLNDDR